MRKIKKVEWRVDVTLSTSDSHQVLRPAVLLQLELDDGSTQLLDLNLASFGRMRFSITELLAEMDRAKNIATLMKARSILPMKPTDLQGKNLPTYSNQESIFTG